MIRSIGVFEEIIGYSNHEISNIVSSLKDATLKKNYYRPYAKKKPNGKQRVIEPSTGKLKDIQKRLNSRIFNQVIFPYYITGGIKKRSGVINAKLHVGKLYHLKTDLVNFFSFITHKNVYSALIGIGFSADVASIITTLTTYNGHLPQGAPTSPFLANLVGLNIDNCILSFAKRKNIIYSRFVDDIICSSNDDFKNNVNEILSIIVNCGFLYSYRKTFYKKGKLEITGAVAGCIGLNFTDNQFLNLINSNVGQSSKKGIVGHLNYINFIDTKFKAGEYSRQFPGLLYPTSIWPYMNNIKSNESNALLNITEYFEDEMFERHL